MQATVSKAEKRLFTLVDDAGSWIKCCAIGMPERSLALVSGFFAFCRTLHSLPHSREQVIRIFALRRYKGEREALFVAQVHVGIAKFCKI